MAMTATVPKIFEFNFDGITLAEQERNPAIVTISELDGFFLNNSVNGDFRIRKSIYEMMKRAQRALPRGCNFMVFEGYRPMARQEFLWNRTNKLIREQYPNATEDDIYKMTLTCTADPHNGIGSAHQAACAIDISLCDDNGVEYRMGTAMHEFNELTETHAEALKDKEIIANRKILLEAMEGADFVNYPAEWWHYSYGDFEWAMALGKKTALYGIIDI